MILAWASTGRQPHAREVAQTIVGTLVWCNANITLVVVAVGPQTFSRTQVTRASQVAHSPETRPEATDIASARQRDTSFQVTTLVTQFVPRLDHTRSVVETVVLEQVELEVERTVLCVDRIRIVPLLYVSVY